jgi:TfoX N-terminal domain
MACDERLVKRIRAVLKRQPGTGERRMFGGVCFMLNGNMVCGVVGTELMVRVGPDKHQDAVQRPHTRKMDFTGQAMKGYVFVDPQGIKGELALLY